MRVLALVFCLFLAACGFRPLYQNTNTLAGDATSLQQIRIANIPDQSGLRLRNALMDRFYHSGRPANPAYVLETRLVENHRDVIIEKDDTTTRRQIVLSAEYRLLEQNTRRVIDSGALRATSAYNILPSQYTTLVTEDDARLDAIRDLADKITLRLATVLE
jgi:LPS-assembly lipoprotein